MSDFFLGKTQAREVDGRCHGRYDGRCRMREILCTKAFQTKKGEVWPISFFELRDSQPKSGNVRLRGSLLGAKWKFARSKEGVCLEQNRFFQSYILYLLYLIYAKDYGLF